MKAGIWGRWQQLNSHHALLKYRLDHGISLLTSLQWLPISLRLRAKTLIMTYKVSTPCPPLHWSYTVLCMLCSLCSIYTILRCCWHQTHPCHWALHWLFLLPWMFSHRIATWLALFPSLDVFVCGLFVCLFYWIPSSQWYLFWPSSPKLQNFTYPHPYSYSPVLLFFSITITNWHTRNFPNLLFCYSSLHTRICAPSGSCSTST